MFVLPELRLSGDKTWAICNKLSVVEDLVFINHVQLPHLLNTTSYKNTDDKVALHSGSSVTMDLVPQESSLNSNRTLDPSVSLGPQVGSNRVVLSGCTVGQVEAGVVTTVMAPSAEQTDTRGSNIRAPGVQSEST